MRSSTSLEPQCNKSDDSAHIRGRCCFARAPGRAHARLAAGVAHSTCPYVHSTCVSVHSSCMYVHSTCVAYMDRIRPMIRVKVTSQVRIRGPNARARTRTRPRVGVRLAARYRAIRRDSCGLWPRSGPLSGPQRLSEALWETFSRIWT